MWKLVKTQTCIIQHEILKNPCSSVNPILCVVNLDEGCRFNKDQKESYSYMTIGGNHSRQAFQEILDEQATLRQNKAYTYRLCSVYTSMEKPPLNRLVLKNNRAAAFCHKMTTWDWISKSRKLLYEMAFISEDVEIPAKKPDGWKSACSAVTSLDVCKPMQSIP